MRNKRSEAMCLLAALTAGLLVASANAAAYQVVALSGVSGSDPRGPGQGDGVSFVQGGAFSGGSRIAADGSGNFYDFIQFPEGNLDAIYSFSPTGVNAPIMTGRDAFAGLSPDVRGGFSIGRHSTAGTTWKFQALTGSGIDGTNDEIYIARTPSGVTSFQKGNQAPGLPTGVAITAFTAAAIGPVGQTFTAVTLVGPGVNTSNDQALFTGSFDNLTPIAREGISALGQLESGRTINALKFNSAFATAAHIAAPIDYQDGANIGSGVYRFAAGQIPVRVVGTGDVTPFGAVASTNLVGGSGNGTLDTTLQIEVGAGNFQAARGTDLNGAFNLYAVEGTDGLNGPGRGPGFAFTSLGNAISFLTETSEIAFTAVSGPTGSGQARKGLFYHTAGSNLYLGQVSDSSPYAGTTIADITGVVANSNDQIIVRVRLTGTGVNTSNDLALLSIRPGDTWQPVLREGGLFDVDTSVSQDLRTISSLQSVFSSTTQGSLYNGNLIFNDLNQLLVPTRFTDGSFALLSVNVPEPTSVTALLASLLMLRRRRSDS